MNFEEMCSILIETKNKMNESISDEVIKEILGLVLKNPLPDDRQKCQEQIRCILSLRYKGE